MIGQAEAASLALQQQVGQPRFTVPLQQAEAAREVSGADAGETGTTEPDQRRPRSRADPAAYLRKKGRHPDGGPQRPAFVPLPQVRGGASSITRLQHAAGAHHRGPRERHENVRPQPLSETGGQDADVVAPMAVGDDDQGLALAAPPKTPQLLREPVSGSDDRTTAI